MKTPIHKILSIGIHKNESSIPRFGRMIFNIDCFLAIFGILMICLSHISDQKFNEYLFFASIGTTVSLSALYLHYKDHFKYATTLFITYNFILIILNTYITRSPMVALYLIPLGLSFFIYFGEKEKYALPYFLFFSLSGIIISIITFSFPSSNSLILNPVNKIISLSIFFLSFLYKITAIVIQHRIALAINDINKSNLKISEQKYRNQFENNLMGMVVFGEKMKVQDVNPAFCNMIGYTKNEIINESILEKCLETSPIILTHFQKLMAGEINKFSTQKTFRRKDGFPLHTTSFVSGNYDKDGKLVSTNCSFLDITEKKETEKQIEIKSQIIEGLVENFPALYYRFDKNLIFTESVGSALKKLGYQNNEIVGVNIEHLFSSHPEIIDKHKKALTGEIVSLEANILLEDGSHVIFDLKLFYDSSTERGIGLGFDITEQKNAEKKVREKENKYKDIFENIYDGIITLDAEGQIINLNQAGRKLLEIGSNDQLNINIKDIVHPDDVNNSKKYLQQLIDQGFYTGYQGRIFTQKGNIRFIEVNSVARKDDDGNLIGSRDIVRDITEKKNSELALRKSEDQYRTIFENAFDGITIFDTNLGKVVEANKKIKAYLKGDSKDFTIEDFNSFLPEYQPNGQKSTTFLAKKIEELLKLKEAQYTCLHTDAIGNERTSYISSIQLPAPHDHLIVTMYNDITEKKKQEQMIQNTLSELNKKNADLKKYIESNGQLENFAYMASHDLKAPLRTITSYSQLLARRTKGKLDETDLEFFKFIIDASKNMSNLIENLLNYSKANSQKKNFESTNVNNMLEIITHELKADIDEKEVSISFENIPTDLIVDQTRLKQLFQNIISNAIKFIEKGKNPEIKIHSIEKENHFEFAIQDNGIGIKPEFHEKIFMLFRKLHGSGEFEGTGIGLALCKKIVEQHGGEIWVESIYGEGTTFFFTIDKNLVMDQEKNVIQKQEVDMVS